MNPGEFRHRLDIVADVGSVAGLQGNVPSASVLASVWAKIEPLRGNEYWRANQSESTATHRVTLRYSPDFTLTTRHWLVHEGRRLDIDEVLNPQERNEQLELLAHEHEGKA